LGTIRPFLSQLIVVDNGSTPSQTAAIVAEFGGQLVREPRPGLCRARNRGLAAAKTDWVVYIDDDVVVELDWLVALTAVYAQNKAVAGVMGLVLPGELETVDQNLFERALGGLGRGFVRRVYRGLAARKAAPQVGVGANMSFRRQAVLQAGGFDEALDPGTPAQAGGDIDLFYRLLKANQTLVYEPAAVVWHTHRRAAGQAQQMSAAYGRGTAAAYAKWAMQGDATAVRMLLGLWLRYYPHQLWLAWTRHNYLTPALAWAGWRGSWLGPWAYLNGRLRLRYNRDKAALAEPPVDSRPSQWEGDETFGH
jgi:GT2 family glycosyltransferase